MLKHQYPRKAFTLTSSYNVRVITLDRPYSVGSDEWGAYTRGGMFYRQGELFDTKIVAIKAGRKKIARIQKNLDRAAESLKKYAAALDKAEAAQAKKG